MLLKNCIYATLVFIGIFSIISLKYSIKNENKYVCKWIIMINSFYILYMIFLIFNIMNWSLHIGWEIFGIYILVFISGIIYAISTGLNLQKRNKLNVYIKAKKMIIITLILILLPVFFVCLSLLENKYAINHSDLILVYKSDNGGNEFNGTDIFAYAIGKHYCKQFDLGIDLGSYSLKDFLPINAIKIKDLSDINYKVKFHFDESTNQIAIIYKNDKEICKIKNKSYYDNPDFDGGFYLGN